MTEYSRRYRFYLQRGDLWALRLAEKIRAARINLAWVRAAKGNSSEHVIRARHPTLSLLATETNREIGDFGDAGSLYWAVLNVAFDSPVDFGCEETIRLVRLRARA